jgi:hypothetical protein
MLGIAKWIRRQLRRIAPSAPALPQRVLAELSDRRVMRTPSCAA